MKPKPLNIVLQGLGAAGRARQRAIPLVTRVESLGILSRRPDMATLSLEKVLADPNVNAIAISLENTQHASAIRQALLANKHVLCDYPIALNATEARELYALAQAKNRILHVEHIGLLTDEHQQLKKLSQQKGVLKKGDYVFQGGWNSKIADLQKTGPYPILCLPRLLQIADWFGKFSITDFNLKVQKGFSLHLHLQFATGGVLGFTEERKAGLPRRRSLIAQCEQGNLHWKAGLGGGNLFAQDLAWFRDRVQEGKNCYYDESLMLQVLTELEKIFPTFESTYNPHN